MKKILLLSLVALLFLFSACVNESPEPLYEPAPVAPEDRQVVKTSQSLGITFRLYNDLTCEVAEVDEAEYDSTSFSLPTHFEKYEIVAIDPEVFRESSFSSVVLPETIRTIGERAFEHSQISEIVLPDSVTEIGKEIFSSCVQLKKVTLSKNLTVIPDGAFYGCRSLAEIRIPEGVVSIGKEAFGDIPSLTKITLPSTLKSVGEWAFWNCGAESIVIPDSLQEVGASAFENAPFLKVQSEEWVLVGDGVLLAYLGEEESVTLPESVRYLSNAFDKSSVKSLTLTDALTGFCEGALEESGVEEILYEGQNEVSLALKESLK